MHQAFIALGSNLEDPQAQVERALETIANTTNIKLIKASSLYRTVPVGYDNQPDFINAVVAIDTSLEALPLLHALLAIEARHGRVRSVPNAPRTLDLDLLMHGDATMAGAELTLPHPRMHERAFVLLPLLEIAPDVLLPGLGAARNFLPAVAGQAIERSEPM